MSDTKRMLERIRDRYGGSGQVNHHKDCEVYRSIRMYQNAPCTCGLLHDLRPLGDGFIKKLFPSYFDDEWRLNAHLVGRKQTKEEINKNIEMIQSVGFRASKETDEQSAKREAEEDALIAEVFGDFEPVGVKG